jgi:hypothetical protein
LQFGIDRVKALAPEHPEWKENKLIQAVLADDINTVLSFGEKGLMELIMTTHAGMTTDEFSQIIKNWINTASHPKTGKLYKEMVYQPMIEVLDYLRSNGFKTWIVSGGGVDFMRPWTEEVYGIPSEQVIGSSIKTAFKMREGNPVLMKLPEINFIDDKEGKPVGIHQYIGKKPVAAFRKLGRRPANAAIYRFEQFEIVVCLYPPYRFSARMGLRPEFAYRET